MSQWAAATGEGSPIYDAFSNELIIPVFQNDANNTKSRQKWENCVKVGKNGNNAEFGKSRNILMDPKLTPDQQGTSIIETIRNFAVLYGQPIF